MIEFTGSNFTFEVFSYVSDDPLRSYNMGRIHFLHSPIGIEYIEGTLKETETEWVQNYTYGEREPIIIGMTIMGIHKIKFKNGEEFIADDLKDARQGLAVPALEPRYSW